MYEDVSTAKKAGKLIKLLAQVEAALNSAEAAEIAAQWDPAIAAQYMKEAGLRMLPEPPLPPPPSPAGNVSSSNGTAMSVPGGGIAKDGVDGSARVHRKDGEVTVSEDIRGRKKGVEIGGGSRRAATKKGKRSDVRPSASGAATMAEGGEGMGEDEKKRKRDGGSRKRKDTGHKRRVEGSASLGGAEGVGDPLEAFVVRVPGRCEVQCLLMVDERDERLVVAIGDALTGEALLGCLFEEPAVVQLVSHGLMQETACVNRAAFQVW